MALADSFDIEFSIKFDLESIVEQKIPFSTFTDRLPLFNIITKSTVDTEKRLMIDLQGVHDAYYKKDFAVVAK